MRCDVQRLRRRGQAKPYNSCPRIDWQHPLAQGLATYCYDFGGFIIDLVNGGFFKVGSGTKSQESQIGRGLNIGLTDWGFMPALPASLINSLGGAIPYSFAAATFFTGAPSTGTQPDGAIVSIQDSANTGNTTFGFNAWSAGSPGNGTGHDVCSCVLNNTTNDFFSTTITANKFQSYGMVATGATAQTLYSDGVFDSNGSATSTFGTVTQPQLMYNTAFTTGPGGFGNAINGFVPFFAMWGGRQLLAQDFLHLHQDPWQFLIYPEEDYDIVGVIASGTLSAQIWL